MPRSPVLPTVAALAAACFGAQPPGATAPGPQLVEIGGNVVDQDGRPVPDATVEIIWEAPSPPHQRLARTVTLEDGEFNLRAELPGHIRCAAVQVVMSAPGYAARMTRKRALSCGCSRVEFQTRPSEGLYPIRPGQGAASRRC